MFALSRCARGPPLGQPRQTRPFNRSPDGWMGLGWHSYWLTWRECYFNGKTQSCPIICQRCLPCSQVLRLESDFPNSMVQSSVSSMSSSWKMCAYQKYMQKHVLFFFKLEMASGLFFVFCKTAVESTVNVLEPEYFTPALKDAWVLIQCFISSSSQRFDAAISIIPKLWLRNLGLSEVEWLVLGHRVRKSWSWDSSSSSPDPKADYLNHSFTWLHRVLSFFPVRRLWNSEHRWDRQRESWTVRKTRGRPLRQVFI